MTEKESKKFYDCFGTEIKLGDYVAFATGSSSDSFYVGRVIRFAATMPIVKVFDWFQKWDQDSGEYVRVLQLREQQMKFCRKSLVISNAVSSMPENVFTALENLNITGKYEKSKIIPIE